MTDSQIQYLVQSLGLVPFQAKNTTELLEQGATLPFIARYRKEKTGGLDEVKIHEIQKLFVKFTEADKRRESIINSIQEQGKMTDSLLKALQMALFTTDLEDLYMPYKPKRKTKASEARAKGLEPLAEKIFKQDVAQLLPLVQEFLNDKVKTVEEALEGARYIIAEWISEDLDVRNRLRIVFEKHGIIKAKVKKGKEEKGQKFRDYFGYEEPIRQIPSHRFLAIKRGENEEILTFSISAESEKALFVLENKFLKGLPEPKAQVQLAIEDSWKRLLTPAMDSEFTQKLKEKSDIAAVKIFADNLRQLLLAPPFGQKRILGVDPGFRTGAKIVVIDNTGELLYDTVIFPFQHTEKAQTIILDVLEKFPVDAIAIGNGTVSRETEDFFKSLFQKNEKKDIPIVVVSEQGASVYSASGIAREELPNKDVTVRGAVSIARRFMDPLAELVKIDPKSIGVGQYQHDVEPKLLKDELETVVMSCVNQVGVELNTASKSLLSYVAGIGPILAQNIVKYRQEKGRFNSREELKKVSRLGEKAFEQAAGFLRIKDAENALDATAVHPESYGVVKKIAIQANKSINELIDRPAILKSLKPVDFVDEYVGEITLKDIFAELEKPGRDPRPQFQTFEFADVKSIEELREGMILPGIVTNITAFGCFVDVGVHQDGLVHISELADRFVKDPNEVVKVHQTLRVKVMEVDVNRKRISLSAKT